MPPVVAQALALATAAHAGQLDKAGRPYIEHVCRVHAGVVAHLDRVPAAAISARDRQEIEVAALLHDTLEDTPHTAGSLREAGISEGVIRRVERLSGRPEGVSYLDNIRAMAREGDVGTMLVKLADNEDNMAPERVALLAPEDRSRVERYARSARILRQGLAARGVHLPD